MLPKVILIKCGPIGSVCRSVSTSKLLDYNFKNSFTYHEEVNDTIPAGWEKAIPFDQIPGVNPVSLFASTWKILLRKFLGQNVSTTHHM